MKKFKLEALYIDKCEIKIRANSWEEAQSKIQEFDVEDKSGEVLIILSGKPEIDLSGVTNVLVKSNEKSYPRTFTLPTKKAVSPKSVFDIKKRLKAATPGPWTFDPDLRPTIVSTPYDEIRDVYMATIQALLEKHPELVEEFEAIKDVHRKNYKYKEECYHIRGEEGTGYDGGGQLVRSMGGNMHRIAEFAKYDNANFDAEFISHAREDLELLIQHYENTKIIDESVVDEGLLIDRQAYEEFAKSLYQETLDKFVSLSGHAGVFEDLADYVNRSSQFKNLIIRDIARIFHYLCREIDPNAYKKTWWGTDHDLNICVSENPDDFATEIQGYDFSPSKRSLMEEEAKEANDRG